MKLQPTRHEDERRILTEWNKDIPVRRCKIIEAKGKVILGKHYHNNNDSIFYMFRGKGNYTLKSAHSSTAKVSRDWMFEGDCLFVPRGVIHTFELLPESIMLEASTEPYDPQDEIQVTE